jgi:hypothetical protein
MHSVPEVAQDYSSTFAANMSLPVHKWFRYTAGFSATWVRSLIEQQKIHQRSRVIDPFAGSGTVLLESELAGVESIGLESQPYIYRIAQVKLDWRYPVNKFEQKALELLQHAKNRVRETQIFPKLIESCYERDALNKLSALKLSWNELEHGDQEKRFTWFVITAILRVTSAVATAQWQYVLPAKRKATVLDPFIAFEKKVSEMCYDMEVLQRCFKATVTSELFNEDAREVNSIPHEWGNLVITSPPYANNYDYADATRLEMSFWGDIGGWADLQQYARKHLVRACTQHVSGFAGETDDILRSPILESIAHELVPTYNRLADERLSHGGKKNYHFMIAAYFYDLAMVFHRLRKVTAKDVLMCFVVGDSAPYGIHVPVDKWLGELAISAGFEQYSFEKLRDRNVKWKNRKHRVPLHEGRLWIKG